MNRRLASAFAAGLVAAFVPLSISTVMAQQPASKVRPQDPTCRGAAHHDGDRDRDRDRWNDRRVNHGTKAGEPKPCDPNAGAPKSAITRPGDPNPYATRAGDPNPYATKAGAPNPYATRAGDPNPYATQAGAPKR